MLGLFKSVSSSISFEDYYFKPLSDVFVLNSLIGRTLKIH